jgi:hypothetical protein
MSVPRDRAPDWVIKDQTLPEQALIYRLSGDYNALHIGAHSLALFLTHGESLNEKQTLAWAQMRVSVV